MLSEPTKRQPKKIIDKENTKIPNLVKRVSSKETKSFIPSMPLATEGFV
jgi:hypothetical protein